MSFCSLTDRSVLRNSDAVYLFWLELHLLPSFVRCNVLLWFYWHVQLDYDCDFWLKGVAIKIALDLTDLLVGGAWLSQLKTPRSWGSMSVVVAGSWHWTALFGDRQLIELARLCSVYTRQTADDFCQYKRDTKVIGSSLSSLLKRVQLLPCVNADFRIQWYSSEESNSCKYTSLIFIKVNGPPSVQIKPKSYVEKCLESLHSSSDLPTGKRTGASNSKHMSLWTTVL